MYNDAYTRIGRINRVRWGVAKNYNKFNRNGNPVGISLPQATGRVIAGKFSSAGKTVLAGIKGVANSLISNQARLVQLEESLRLARVQNLTAVPQIEKNIATLKAKMAANAAASKKTRNERINALKSVFNSKVTRMQKLKEKLRQAQSNGTNVSQIQANIAKLDAEIQANAAAKAQQNAKKQQEEALRRTIKEALTTLNVKGNSVSNNNRSAYVKALQSYKNFRGNGFEYSMSNRNIGVNRYSTTTGLKRTGPGKPPPKSTFNTHHEFIRNMKEKLRKNPSPALKSRMLDDALINLSRRLGSISNNRRALDMIDNYRRLSSNTTFTSNLNRRAGRYKTTKKNDKNKKNNKGGWSGGGQQIIFGGGAPGAGGGAPPQFINRGGGGAPAAAPVIIPGPGAAAPVIVPGGGGAGPSITGPTVSVNPTIRVNVPPAAAQAATQMLPQMERSALNNAGGYRRAASLVQNAGGPESVSRALTALRNSGGNVQRAMQNSGLPKNVFTNVNKLGGPVTARRALTAVKKVSKKTGRPSTFNLGSPSTRRPASSVRPATVNLGRVAQPRRTKKKRVSSACATCKKPRDNHIRLIVSQLRRNNLERNYLKCLLP